MPAGVYLHIPFCKSRCSYCDFATDVYRNNEAVERYVAALCNEVRTPCVSGGYACGTQTSYIDASKPPAHAGGSDTDIDTIYFGGGTPSLLAPKQVDQILNAVHSTFSVLPGAEITMEMNPATVTPQTLAAFRSLGINRASFGVQTFDDRALKLLARGHDAEDARSTFRMLRDAGFDNISFDLIAGLPGQTLGAWERNLDQAIAMQPEHMSLYLLEIHEGTPMAEQVRSGRATRPDEGLTARMYELMLDRLAGAGFEQYEISNFCRHGLASRHNSKYWTLDPVLGFGVSAHSFNGKERYANERDTAGYVELIETGGTAEVMREAVDLASDFIFLGLRMENGIDLPAFATRFGFDLTQKHRSEIDRLVDAGLVELTDVRLRLTQKGKLFSNEVFAVFV